MDATAAVARDVSMPKDDVVCWLAVPIDASILHNLLIGLDDCVVDVDDAENIVIRRVK